MIRPVRPCFLWKVMINMTGNRKQERVIKEVNLRTGSGLGGEDRRKNFEQRMTNRNKPWIPLLNRGMTAEGWIPDQSLPRT